MVRKFSIGLSLFFILIIFSISACSLREKPEDQTNTTSNTRGESNNDESQDVLTSIRQVDPVIMPQQAATPTLVPVSVLEEARADDLVFINIYQRVNPAVVNIEISDAFSGTDSLDSSGSGFVIDLDGHIVTNAHVVQNSDEILVTFSDGSVTRAELIGADTYSDIAVIKVDLDPARLIPVELGDSSELLVGERVVAIGNPFGLESSMTVGIISALGRALPSERLINGSTAGDGFYNNPSIIQIDATVNPGNSGGPILNMDGRVVGVATAIRTETGGFQGVAFAVPVNTVKRVIPQLIENGEVSYPWLGVRAEGLFRVGELADPLDLPVQSGVLVGDIIPNSPAEDAGLQGGNEEIVYRGLNIRVGGDIIVAVNGVFVDDLDELLAYLVENTQPNDDVTLTVVRGNQTLEIVVKLGTRPGNGE